MCSFMISDNTYLFRIRYDIYSLLRKQGSLYIKLNDKHMKIPVLNY